MQHNPASSTPFLALDLSQTFSRFDEPSLLQQLHDEQTLHDDELEAILAQLDELRKSTLVGIYRVYEGHQKEEREELEKAIAGDVVREEREETAKSTLTKVLDDVSSALSSLFGRSVKTPTDPPSSLRPLLLVDPRTTTEASDVEALREHLCEAQEREKDELEVIVKDIYDLFTDFSVALYRTYRRTRDARTAELKDTMNSVVSKEDDFEHDRLAIETCLESLKAAFAGLEQL